MRIQKILFSDRCFILLIVSLLFLSGCQVDGVVYKDGEPLRSVAVKISNGDESRTALTDSEGRYSFDVPAGSYYVSLVAPEGYSGESGRRIFKASDTSSVEDVSFRFDSETEINIAQGSVTGFYEDNGTISYQGIRIATPPVGEHRWQAPQAIGPSSERVLSIAPGDMCIQLGDKLNGAPTFLYGAMIGSEDCLYLNIWVPEGSSEGDDLPVMVWIYGGGNSLGESSTYTGKYLAETHGVIVVNFNYRTGPLGWFSYPPMYEEGASIETRSGNYGTLDQINALRWVSDNISAFGGDKQNVTIFGESAGASATLAMMASPLTKGLFHRAAVQSAALGWITDHSIWQTRSIAENLSDAANPGYRSSSSEIVIAALIAAGQVNTREEAKQLVDRWSAVEISRFMKQLSPGQLYQLYETKLGAFLDMPTIIQDGVVIPESDVLSLFKSGAYHQVPVIIGTNRDEYKLFLLSRPYYTTQLADTLPIIQNSNDYQLAGEYYSDAWGITAMFDLANAMAQHQSNVFVYRFDWDEQPDLVALDMAEILGAAHGLEIGFTMNNPDLAVTPSLSFALFTETNRPGREYLAQVMSSYWTNFAESGQPNENGTDALVTWKPWAVSASSSQLMAFDTPEDMGTRMISVRDDMASLKQRVRQESGFDSDSRYCNLYSEIFGVDEFLMNRCPDVAR